MIKNINNLFYRMEPNDKELRILGSLIGSLSKNKLESNEILKNSDNNLKILMHCFTGSLSFAIKLMELNSFFSASGIITFKNSTDLQNTFKELPIERLLIETDSPFLAPEPMRGKKNEPSFVRYTLKKLSELKNLEVEDLDKITTENFNRLFFNK